MAPPRSQSARMAIATQASKGTYATTGFVGGIMQESGGQPAYVYSESGAEHSGGATTRTTNRKSAARRESQLEEFDGKQWLYPELIGTLLRGIGFGVSSVNNTTHRTHTFTMANIDLHAWLTVLTRFGEGAAQFERRIRDGRLNALNITGGVREGLSVDFSGLGLLEQAALGTETVANEPNVRFQSSEGAMTTFTVAGQAITATFKGLELRIANDLSREELVMFAYGNSDLPSQGYEISGVLRGLEVEKDVYKHFNWGGVAGTAPAEAMPVGALAFTLETPTVIPAAAVPYSLGISVPSVEYRIGNFRARGSELMRFDLAWNMIDDSSTPITATLVNGKASF